MNKKFSIPSPSGRHLVKLTILLVFCCFAESAAGSCIRYGHSCWGAHGKRGFQVGPPLKNTLPVMKDMSLIDNVPPDTKLFFTRLLQAADNRISKGGDIFQELKQFQEENDGNLNRNNDKVIDDPVDSGDIYPSLSNKKLRLLKYLENVNSN